MKTWYGLKNTSASLQCFRMIRFQNIHSYFLLNLIERSHWQCSHTLTIFLSWRFCIMKDEKTYMHLDVIKVLHFIWMPIFFVSWHWKLEKKLSVKRIILFNLTLTFYGDHLYNENINDFLTTVQIAVKDTSGTFRKSKVKSHFGTLFFEI